MKVSLILYFASFSPYLRWTPIANAIFLNTDERCLVLPRKYESCIVHAMPQDQHIHSIYLFIFIYLSTLILYRKQ